MSEPIKIWRFDDTPEEYKQMSEHGGDEDFVMLVPLTYAHEFLPDRIVDAGMLGCCSTDSYETSAGMVYIGAHA